MFNSAVKMGKTTGTTDGGFPITSEWLPNDGLLIKTDVLPIYLQFMTAICQLDEAKLGNGANTNTPNWLKNQKWYQKDAA